MAYQTPITIKEAIDRIKAKHYVLPSIQREFVWGTEQIETLFDSLMRDYPISTFLFWAVDKSKVKDFQFYEFLKNYHEKDNQHNLKLELGDDRDIIALLDGQQRMTSMYLALCGSYAEKMPYFRKSSVHAYPEKHLYLNLLSTSEDMEREYDFRFLTKEEALPTDKSFWFKCSEILVIDADDILEYLMSHDLTDSSIYKKEVTKFAQRTLSRLHRCVHDVGTISYYLEKSIELDKVLQIFIRINSGGTKLSYSDLLLSIATAQWTKRDAREVIHEFVDDLNKIGNGFSFSKDQVLKSCLVLSDFSDVRFKADNFNKSNMEKIEEAWDGIAAAIRTAVELFAKLGYDRDTLSAANAMIPIAYYIYKNSIKENDMVHAGGYAEDRSAIREWLARVLVKGTFGGQPDSIYPGMRQVVNANLGKFPLAEIIEHYRGQRKSIAFTGDDIDGLLDLQYGKGKTFAVISELYAGRNLSFNFHQDHIHPKSLFNRKRLKALGVPSDDIEDYISKVNSLSNLQLLQGTENIEKRASQFEGWVMKAYPNERDRNTFLLSNEIPIDQSLAIVDFLEFIEKRRDNLKLRLKSIFKVKAEDSAS